MIRNLKALMLAAMALAAFGALAVSSAGAHTPAQFHSHLSETTLTVKTDGTAKTAHAVLDVPGAGGVTCEGVSGHGLGKSETATSVDVTLTFEKECTALGQTATVDTTNCVFGFKANGEVELKGAGCTLTITALGCAIDITTPKTYTGITYHNISSAGVTVGGTATYVTVSAKIGGIHGLQTGPFCPVPGTFSTGEFTTGNVTVEGEKPGTTEMTSVWWTPTAP